MKRKTITIGILICLISAGITNVSAIGINNNIKTENPEISSMNEDTHLTIDLVSIYMLDYIDVDWLGSPNFLADFYFKIWVYGGVDNDGDNFWRYDMPDDLQYCDDINADHTWNIGQKEKVTIKIEVWDRDVFLDDFCDINGYSVDKRSVTFEYNIITNGMDLSGTGGYMLGYQACFDGREDGSENYDDDDVHLRIRVYDDYICPRLRTSYHKLEFGEVKVGEYRWRPVCFLSNIGELTATGYISLVSGDLDEFVITENGGAFTLPVGWGRAIGVDFKPKSKGAKQVTLLIDGDDPCNDISLVLTGSGTARSRTREISSFLQNFLERIDMFPLLERLLKLV